MWFSHFLQHKWRIQIKSFFGCYARGNHSKTLCKNLWRWRGRQEHLTNIVCYNFRVWLTNIVSIFNKITKQKLAKKRLKLILSRIQTQISFLRLKCCVYWLRAYQFEMQDSWGRNTKNFSFYKLCLPARMHCTGEIMWKETL